MRDALWVLRDKKIAVWGLTFKPDTDDIRSSVAIDLVADMLREGAQVDVYDPKGMEKAREVEAIAKANFANSAMEAVDGVEALVVATEWGEFCNVDLAVVKERMTTPIIFDGRNIFDPQTMTELGFHYHSVGRQAVKPALAARLENDGSTPPLRCGRLRRMAQTGTIRGRDHSRTAGGCAPLRVRPRICSRAFLWRAAQS